MFEFSLLPVDEIEPWGTAPRLSLHWFGLTLGSYFIDLGDHKLLEYARDMDGEKFVTYQVARLHEDLQEILPFVLEAVPEDLVEGLLDQSFARTDLAISEQARGIDLDDPIHDALESFRVRMLDSLYLQPRFRVWFWRLADRIVIEWDNRHEQIDGLPAWSADFGRQELGIPDLFSELERFHDRLMSEIESRIQEISSRWSRPWISIDVPDLERDHRQRDAAFRYGLRQPPATSNWSFLRSALRKLRAIDGDGRDGLSSRPRSIV